jgi:hypothetical protein
MDVPPGPLKLSQPFARVSDRGLARVEAPGQHLAVVQEVAKLPTRAYGLHNRVEVVVPPARAPEPL